MLLATTNDAVAARCLTTKTKQQGWIGRHEKGGKTWWVGLCAGEGAYYGDLCRLVLLFWYSCSVERGWPSGSAAAAMMQCNRLQRTPSRGACLMSQRVS